MKTAALTLFLLFVQISAFPQSAKRNSFIKIEATSGKLVASGLVPEPYLKVMAADDLHTVLSPDVSTEGILVDEKAEKLPYAWNEEFKAALRDRKRWANGVFIFEVDEEKRREAILESIGRAEIKLLGEKGKKPLLDKGKKVTLLYLFATWCGPCRNQLPFISTLDLKYAPKGLDVLMIDADDESERDIEEFHKSTNISLKTTIAESELTHEFLELSEFGGIPQAFLFSDGKLVRIYRGGAPKENERMLEDITAIIVR